MLHPMTEEHHIEWISLQTRTALLIIQIQAICPLAIPKMFFRLWIFKTNFSRFIQAERYSILFSAKSCRIGNRLRRWCERLRKTMSCRTIPYRRPIRSVPTMAILQASKAFARNAATKPRFTAVLPVITARCRTGTTARVKSFWTERRTV